MQFNFDPGKDAVNLSKHCLSLAAAAELRWEAALVWIDDRADYGEARMVALAPVGDLTDRHISGETVMRQPAAALAEVVALEAAQSA